MLTFLKNQCRQTCSCPKDGEQQYRGPDRFISPRFKQYHQGIHPFLILQYNNNDNKSNYQQLDLYTKSIYKTPKIQNPKLKNVELENVDSRKSPMSTLQSILYVDSIQHPTLTLKSVLRRLYKMSYIDSKKHSTLNLQRVQHCLYKVSSVDSTKPPRLTLQRVFG